LFLTFLLIMTTRRAFHLLFFPALLFGAMLATHGAPAIPVGTGVKYELIGRLEIDRLNRILTNEAPAFTGQSVAYTPARNAVRLFRVTYPSFIPERANRPTLASGLIAIPVTGGKTMPLVSYQHGTVVLGKHAVPSFPEESPETLLMLAQFAGQGYVVIGADYFGLGTSPEAEGYTVMGSHEQACLDLYSASQGVLENEGIKTSGFFLSGWSQGGLVTMALVAKFENIAIPVRAAGTAAAQCDAFAMLNGYLSFPRKIDAPWVCTLFILSAFSYEQYYGLPGLAEALFTPEQYELARRIYRKEPVKPEESPGDLHKLIRKDYFDPQYFAQSAYGRLMHQVAPYRRVIKTPVQMYYGDIDECLSVGIARLPMVYQQSIGNDTVEAISAGASANHRGAFAVAVARWKTWFDLQASK
jgi:hypothetical protein